MKYKLIYSVNTFKGEQNSNNLRELEEYADTIKTDYESGQQWRMFAEANISEHLKTIKSYEFQFYFLDRYDHYRKFHPTGSIENKKTKYKQPELKPEKLQKLIDLVEKAMPFAKKNYQLNMEMSVVRWYRKPFHNCGTDHCFAGWVAVASSIRNNKIEQPNKNIEYDYGIEIINNILGIDFAMWVKENLKLWGNKYYGQLYDNEMAFYHKTKRPDGAKNLSHIRDHLVELKPRLIKN